MCHRPEKNDIMNPSPVRGNRMYLVFMILIICLGATLRFIHLGDQSLWLDEVMFVEAATSETAEGVISYMTHRDFHPPVYAFLLRGWIDIFGNTDLSVRLLPMLIGLIVILLTYLLSMELTGNRFIAFGSAIIVAFGGFHIYLSQEGRHYTLLAAVGTGHIICFIRYIRSGRAFWFGAAFLTALAGLFTHYHMALILSAEILFAFRENRRGGSLFVILIPFILFFVLWGPSLLVQAEHRSHWGEGLIDPMSGIGQVIRTVVNDIYWTLIDFSTGKYLLLLGSPGFDLPDLLKIFIFLLFGLCGLIGMVFFLTNTNDIRPHPFSLVITISLISVGGAIISGFLQSNVYETKYVSFVAPLWAICVAAGVWYLRRFSVTGIVTIIMIFGLIASAYLYHTEAFPWKEDWESTAETVTENWQAGDLLLQRRHYTKACLERYLDFEPERLESGTTFLPDSTVADSVAREVSLRDGNRLWYVGSHDEYGTLMLELLEEHFETISHMKYQGIIIRCMKPRFGS